MGMSIRLRLAVVSAFVALTTAPSPGQFTPGQIVVLRVGDGSAALGSGATAVSLLQYDPTTASQTTPTLTVAVPWPASTNSGSGQTISGTSTSEGQITRSADGQSLVLAGYNAAIPTA